MHLSAYVCAVVEAMNRSMNKHFLAMGICVYVWVVVEGTYKFETGNFEKILHVYVCAFEEGM